MGKTKSIRHLVALFVAVFVSACSSTDEAAISVEEFASMVDSKACLIVDVRTAEEYVEGHIEGAATIDFYSPEFEHKFRFIDVNQCMVFYCNTGNRSGQAVHLLKEELGFANIVLLNGGMNAWEEAGYGWVED